MDKKAVIRYLIAGALILGFAVMVGLILINVNKPALISLTLSDTDHAVRGEAEGLFVGNCVVAAFAYTDTWHALTPEPMPIPSSGKFSFETGRLASGWPSEIVCFLLPKNFKTEGALSIDAARKACKDEMYLGGLPEPPAEPSLAAFAQDDAALTVSGSVESPGKASLLAHLSLANDENVWEQVKLGTDGGFVLSTQPRGGVSVISYTLLCTDKGAQTPAANTAVKDVDFSIYFTREGALPQPDIEPALVDFVQDDEGHMLSGRVTPADGTALFAFFEYLDGKTRWEIVALAPDGRFTLPTQSAEGKVVAYELVGALEGELPPANNATPGNAPFAYFHKSGTVSWDDEVAIVGLAYTEKYYVTGRVVAPNPKDYRVVLFIFVPDPNGRYSQYYVKPDYQPGKGLELIEPNADGTFEIRAYHPAARAGDLTATEYAVFLVDKDFPGVTHVNHIDEAETAAVASYYEPIER